MDVPQGKPQQASGWSPPMVGDFHALDRFGELVFGDAQGAVPPPPRSRRRPRWRRRRRAARRRTPVSGRRRPQGNRRGQGGRRREQEEVDGARRFSLAPRSGERVGVRGRVALAAVPAGRVRVHEHGAATSPLHVHALGRSSSDSNRGGESNPSAGSPRRARREGAMRRRSAADGRSPPPRDGLGRALLAEVRAAARKQRRRPPETRRAARLGDDRSGAARPRRRAAGARRRRFPARALRAGRAVAPHPAVERPDAAAPPSCSARARGEIAEMLRDGRHRARRHRRRSDRRHDLHRARPAGAARRRCWTRSRGACRRGGRAPIAARIAPRAHASRGRDHRARRHRARADAAAARRRGARRASVRAPTAGTRSRSSRAARRAAPCSPTFPCIAGSSRRRAAPRGAGVRPTSVTAEEAETQLLALINRDRKLAGVAPVVAGRAADGDRARPYATTWSTTTSSATSHRAPAAPVDRVHRAGLTPTFVSENVGRGYTAEEAEQGFMSSPGHRANIVDPRPRRVGIGIVYGAPVTGTTPLFVTQLFTN